MLTVIAYADTPGVRVERLLWGLAKARPNKPKVELLVLDLNEEPDGGLLNQLGLYRSGFPWKLLRSLGDTTLGSIVRGTTVLSLPASAVPAGDALWELAAAAPARAATFSPGGLCVYAMDALGANLTAAMVEGCARAEVPAFAIPPGGWGPHGFDDPADAPASFVLYPVPNGTHVPLPDDPVTVLECNT